MVGLASFVLAGLALTVARSADVCTGDGMCPATGASLLQSRSALKHDHGATHSDHAAPTEPEPEPEQGTAGGAAAAVNSGPPSQAVQSCIQGKMQSAMNACGGESGEQSCTPECIQGLSGLDEQLDGSCCALATTWTPAYCREMLAKTKNQLTGDIEKLKEYCAAGAAAAVNATNTTNTTAADSDDGDESETCPVLDDYVKKECNGHLDECKTAPSTVDSNTLCRGIMSSTPCQDRLNAMKASDQQIWTWYRKSCTEGTSMVDRGTENSALDEALVRKPPPPRRRVCVIGAMSNDGEDRTVRCPHHRRRR